MEIEVFNGNIDEAIRLLKRKVSYDGILKELKLRESFESRIERRKRKDRIALKRKKQRERRYER